MTQIRLHPLILLSKKLQLALAEHRFELHRCTYTWIFKKKHLHCLIQVESLWMRGTNGLYASVCATLHSGLENLRASVSWGSWDQFPCLGTTYVLGESEVTRGFSNEQGASVPNPEVLKGPLCSVPSEECVLLLLAQWRPALENTILNLKHYPGSALKSSGPLPRRS